MTPLPVHIISGALGAGKTTAIQHLLAHKPAHERWAVLVNEFGLVGLDAALLTQPALDVGRSDVTIEEIPGGCICCSAGLMFQVALLLLIQRARPDRVIIEPTGLAGLRSIIRALRGPGLSASLELRSVITLVDATRWEDAALRDHEIYAEQIAEADVLLASRADLATPRQLQRFMEEASALFPPKRHIGMIARGALDPALLDPPQGQQRSRRLDPHELTLRLTPTGLLVRERAPPPPTAPGIYPSDADDEVSACGWIYAPEEIFSEERLLGWLRAPGLPQAPLRIKGVLRVEDGWISLNATADQRTLSASNYTRDSRVEIIAPATPQPDWTHVGALLRACLSGDAAHQTTQDPPA
jgi:G3E family GTPase